MAHPAHAVLDDDCASRRPFGYNARMAAALPDRAALEIAKPKPRRWGRWFRFSLATMFVAVTVLCVVLAVIARRAEQERRAVALIEKRGGTIVYDFQYQPTGLHDYDATPPCPKWVENLIGIHYFARVAVVSLYRSDVRDDDLIEVGNLSGLRELLLEGCPVTNSGLKHLQNLKRLEVFHSHGSKIDDDGLKYLAHKRLHCLSLVDLRITGSGLAHLNQCTNLEELWLHDSDINDEGLSLLPRFPKLWLLDLQGTKVSNTDLKHLTGFPVLQNLSLEATAIDDAGVGQLSKLENLKTLSLNHTRVTELGLATLASSPKLDTLWIADNGYSPEAIERIRRTVPKCSIISDGFTILEPLEPPNESQ